MDRNSYSENTPKTNEKQLNKVKEFLSKFIAEVKLNNSKSNNILARGHLVWKENLKNRPKKETEEKEDDEAFKFYSTEFDFSKDFALSLANTIYEKLEQLIKLDQQDFTVNQKMTHESYGYENNWKYDVLEDYLKSMCSLTSKDKKNLITEGDGRKKVKAGTSLALEFIRWDDGKQVRIFFIILINLKNALSKSSKKILLNLDKLSETKKIENDTLIIEPDSFDCIVFEKELFVFNQIYFYYLFFPIRLLESEIEKSRSKIEKSINNSDSLISYAKKNPAHVRDLYYFVSKEAQIPPVKMIEDDLKVIQTAGVKRSLFTITTDGRIDCNEHNAGLVLSYLVKKLGLKIHDRRLMNVEASTDV